MLLKRAGPMAAPGTKLLTLLLRDFLGISYIIGVWLNSCPCGEMSSMVPWDAQVVLLLSRVGRSKPSRGHRPWGFSMGLRNVLLAERTHPPYLRSLHHMYVQRIVWYDIRSICISYKYYCSCVWLNFCWLSHVRRIV